MLLETGNQQPLQILRVTRRVTAYLIGHTEYSSNGNQSN